MSELAFTADDIRQALAACTPLCQCQVCKRTRDESYVLLAAWLNARLLEKITQEKRRKG